MDVIEVFTLFGEDTIHLDSKRYLSLAMRLIGY